MDFNNTTNMQKSWKQLALLYLSILISYKIFTLLHAKILSARWSMIRCSWRLMRLCWSFWLLMSAFSIILLKIWACDLHYCWQEGSEVSGGWWFISPCPLLISRRFQRSSGAINWMQIFTEPRLTRQHRIPTCRSAEAVLQVGAAVSVWWCLVSAAQHQGVLEIRVKSLKNVTQKWLLCWSHHVNAWSRMCLF